MAPIVRPQKLPAQKTTFALLAGMPFTSYPLRSRGMEVAAAASALGTRRGMEVGATSALAASAQRRGAHQRRHSFTAVSPVSTPVLAGSTCAAAREQARRGTPLTRRGAHEHKRPLRAARALS